MDGKEAKSYIQGVRKDRKTESNPLHNPTTPPEVRTSTIGDLKAYHDLLHEDPNYRQAMRIIAELREKRGIKKPDNKAVERKAEFPTNPEERYKIILSSIGNNAGKQITFLSIPSIAGVVTTPHELHVAFMENSKEVWKTGRPLQGTHARKSLIPIGMVAEEVGFRNGLQREVVGFTQTETGRTYGDPVARFLLKYAAEHNISLEKILGGTGSSSNLYTPYTRTCILEYLDKNKDNPNIKIIDIQNALKLPTNQVVVNALAPLMEGGLVMFETLNPQAVQGKFTFSLNHAFEGELRSNYGYDLSDVVETISSLRERGVDKFEIDTVLHEIQKKNPDYKRKRIGYVLADLAKSGYLVRGDFKGGEIHSSATILEEGIDFVKKVLKPLRIALTDTPEGEALRHGWGQIPWQLYAPRALEIHQEISKQANRTDRPVLEAKVLQMITENTGIRTFDIHRQLKKAGFPSLQHTVLNNLMERGLVVKTKKGNVTHWYLVESPTKSDK